MSEKRKFKYTRPDDPGRLDRIHLLTSNESEIRGALANGRTLLPGASRPVILVMDTRDKVAMSIAVQIDRQRVLDAHARMVLGGVIPTVITVLPTTAVVELLAEAQPNLSDTLASCELPTGWAWVVCVASGGACYLPMEPDHG